MENLEEKGRESFKVNGEFEDKSKVNFIPIHEI
jgi:hypothetical protein